MERRKGLARTSRLERRTRLKAGTKRLKAVSKKRQARVDAWPAIRDAALERAGSRCEYVDTFDDVDHRCEHTMALHVHHRLRRSQGGSDCDANLRVLCAEHHQSVHDFPTIHTQLGYLVASHQWEARELRVAA